MKRPSAALLLAMLFALAGLADAGERYLLGVESTLTATQTGERYIAVGEGPERRILLLGEGRVETFRWAPPVLEALETLSCGDARVVPVPVDPSGRWLLCLAPNGQDYQLLREAGGVWSKTASGSLGGKVIAAVGGRFSAGEGAGLFAQFDSGRVGYWVVGGQGCLLVWQSPEPWPGVAAACSTDLNGDGFDEAILLEAAGAISVIHWRNGLWENVWTLPPWGQVLAFDAGQADDQPGSEVVITTSQRRLLMIGATEGAFTVKARLTTAKVAVNVALLPRTQGAVVLGDAAGGLDLFWPEGDTWRLESHLSGGERPIFLCGLDQDHIVTGTASGTLCVVQIKPIAEVAVYLDGLEVKNTGLYWDDDEFYFSPAFLQSVLGIAGRWEDKKGLLTLSQGQITVVISANKSEVTVSGRPWSIGRNMVISGKTPYVPAKLLSSVFLINVTYDPACNWLILTKDWPT